MSILTLFPQFFDIYLNHTYNTLEDDFLVEPTSQFIAKDGQSISRLWEDIEFDERLIFSKGGIFHEFIISKKKI